jgi:hypothetical protein
MGEQLYSVPFLSHKNTRCSKKNIYLLTNCRDVQLQIEAKHHFKTTIDHMVGTKSAFDMTRFSVHRLLRLTKYAVKLDYIQWADNGLQFLELEYPFSIGWIGATKEETKRMRIVISHHRGISRIYNMFPCE